MIAVGSLYMFSIVRGYTDGFIQWCKQIIGICLTAFLQAVILIAGLGVMKENCLLGIGLILAASEIPRIAGQFGLDTSMKANIMSTVYAGSVSYEYYKNNYEQKLIIILHFSCLFGISVVGGTA